MKRLLLILLISASAWGISPQDFNQALLEGVREDIKQDRFTDQSTKTKATRGPASIERQEEFEIKEYQRKNKVNGLQEKW